MWTSPWPDLSEPATVASWFSLQRQNASSVPIMSAAQIHRASLAMSGLKPHGSTPLPPPSAAYGQAESSYAALVQSSPETSSLVQRQPLPAPDTNQPNASANQPNA
jgi:hypothetical protein